MILLQIAGTLMGLVIFVRAIRVIAKMDVRARAEHYLQWLVFGMSYALLAVAALGAVFSLWECSFDVGSLAWLGASSGLILFDRRRRRDAAAAAASAPRPFWMFWAR